MCPLENVICDVINFRSNNDCDKDKKVNYFSVPCIGPSSDIISKILRSMDSKICISFVSHTIYKKNLFSKTKDKTFSSLLNIGVVYKGLLLWSLQRLCERDVSTPKEETLAAQK